MTKFKVAFSIVSLSTGFVAITAWYRPVPDYGETRSGPALRKQLPFISSKSVTDIAGEKEPILLNLARRMSGFINISFFRFFMTTLGKVTVKKDENYAIFLDRVVSRHAEVPLITISNHRSMADDPGAMSCLLPYWTAVKPQHIRWSLCAQDYCFNKKVGG